MSRIALLLSTSIALQMANALYMQFRILIQDHMI